MAAARRCDRCGCFYEQYGVKNNSNNVNGIATLNIDRHGKYFIHQPKDLCPQCMNFFTQWLGGNDDGHCKTEITNQIEEA